ncbi:hypothetical protein [Halpernia sp.]|uniref:hypothetical protein n=1 Tax=Halpernia sp. TaxID=2782209 RepID=UPI003A93E19B
MNNRLLEILKNPELLVLTDIEILEKEISKNPFAQSFRAVQLLATHRFKEDLYNAKLSETAAFTTDKKILYHLIHQKKVQDNFASKENNENAFSEDFSFPKNEKEEIIKENEPISKVEKLIATPETKFQEIKISPKESPKEVFVNGELNRILFEGEEDFLNEETLAIDLEATKESGNIVIAEKENVPNFVGKENNSGDYFEGTRKFTTETVIDEDEIKTEENIIENPSQLSFHGSQEFLSEVKIEVKKESVPYFIAENKISKHELEMQKLIAEVEAKMKKSSAKKSEKDEDFENNYSLDFTGISHEETPENIVEQEKPKENLVEQKEEITENPTWKPMSFVNHNSNPLKVEKPEFEESAEISEEEIAEKPEEFPEIKMSFFGSKVEEINEEKKSDSTENTSDDDKSNVPIFINTWQSWLKLKPETSVPKENIKQKAIEKFIEKEPKISRLKEESNFTVKDKGDNISHLMTETLANLYLDQKLYAKAQKAFELLIEKEPEKKEKFEEKLKQIKELKNQKN